MDLFTLGTNMQKFFVEIQKWRSDLESQNIDSTSTSDTVALITYVQSLKKQIKPYQEQVSLGCIL
jgi:dynein heavy chain 1, cytosolic